MSAYILTILVTLAAGGLAGFGLGRFSGLKVGARRVKEAATLHDYAQKIGYRGVRHPDPQRGTRVSRIRIRRR